MMDLIDRGLELTKKYAPSQAEVFGSRNKVTTIRLATSEIVESKTVTVQGVGIRLVHDKSIGFASTTDISTNGIEEAIEKANHAAKAKKADPDFVTLPEPRKNGHFVAADNELLALDLEKAVDYGRIALETAKSLGKDLDISGSINFVSEESFIRNSLGVDGKDVATFVYSSITAEKGEDLSTVGQDCARTLKDLKPEKATKEAVDLSRKSTGGKDIQPGKYDVILSPYAFTELAEYVLAYAVDASAVDANLSYFTGRLGQDVSADLLTLTDDGRHPTGIASKTIDDEGVPTGTTPIIRKGVLQNFLSDTYYAYKLSSSLRTLSPTGNAFRFGSVPGRDPFILPQIQATNLVTSPGDHSVDELIAETRRGLLIGRIWYTYPINPTIGEFSTTNRGSTFLIENGRILHPILPNSFRINDNIQALLKNIAALSKETVQSVVWGGASASISPYVKIKDVNITYSKGEQLVKGT
ncbi:MAG: TldD/PmbA family protein [Candidatus Bathyarchaeia archaeon]